MKRSQFIGLLAIAVIASFAVGVWLGDFPYLEIEKRVRPFEALNFLVILFFGYWFQNLQRQKVAKTSSIQKLLDITYSELASEVNSIVEVIESTKEGDAICDDVKKRISLKQRNISTNIKLICDHFPSAKEEINDCYIIFKDSVLEDVNLAAFVMTSTYLKNVSSRAIELKSKLRTKMYQLT